MQTPSADALTELRERVAAIAVQDGSNLTSHPDVHAVRASVPAASFRARTQGVVVAVVASRHKRIELTDGRSFDYRPGNYLCCTRAMQYHASIPAASRAHPYLSMAVQLRPEQIAEAVLDLEHAGASPADDSDAFIAQLDAGLLDTLLRLLRALADPLEARLLVPLATRELTLRLLRAELAGPLRRAAQADDGRIGRAMQFIRQNAHDRVTIEQLAKQAGMSPSHFAHLFRRVARMTPMQYHKQQRLLRARSLLLDDLRVSEVAREVGYQSPAQFTRDFKASYGAPPASYAQRLRALSE